MIGIVSIHDIVRVHPGVEADHRNLGGVLLTVVVGGVSELEATETAGGRPFHLHASDVDVVFRAGVL